MLILLRHGQSVANAEGRLVGRIDARLSDIGRAEAAAVGASLVQQEISAVICSPLRRARDTALIARPDVEPTVDERWIELDYGQLDGAKLDTVEPAVWSKWINDTTFCPQGGESIADLGERVRSACEELFATDGAGARGADGHVLVVSHVSPIKAAVAWALGAQDDLCWRLHLSTGSITRIGWGANGPVMHSFNEVF